VWGASLLVSPWARLWPFWLSFCFTLVQVPLTAESTTSGPARPETSPLNATDFDGALKQLRAMLETSLQDSLNLRAEAEDLRTGLESWQAEAIKLSSMLTALRKDSEALSNSLTDSLKREAGLKAASDRQDEVDAQAVKEARLARDEARAWNLWAWIGGATTGALTALGLAHILGW
jgi:hypothetical protein